MPPKKVTKKVAADRGAEIVEQITGMLYPAKGRKNGSLDTSKTGEEIFELFNELFSYEPWKNHQVGYIFQEQGASTAKELSGIDRQIYDALEKAGCFKLKIVPLCVNVAGRSAIVDCAKSRTDRYYKEALRSGHQITYEICHAGRYEPPQRSWDNRIWCHKDDNPAEIWARVRNREKQERNDALLSGFKYAKKKVLGKIDGDVIFVNDMGRETRGSIIDCRKETQGSRGCKFELVYNCHGLLIEPNIENEEN